MKKWAASFRYGNPSLAEVEIISETNKIYQIGKYLDIFGIGMYLNKRERKVNRKIKWFDYFTEALLFLVEQEENHIQTLRKDLDTSIKTHAELVAMLREASEKR